MSDDTLLRTTPPHAIEAEGWLVGALLTRGDEVLDLARLSSAEFYSPRAGEIWASAERLRRAGKPVGGVAIVEELRASGRLEAVGGVAKVIESFPGTGWVDGLSDVDALASRIREAAEARAKIVALTEARDTYLLDPAPLPVRRAKADAILAAALRPAPREEAQPEPGAPPEIDLAWLPEWLGRWAHTVEASVQVPRAYPVLLGLAAVSAALARRLEVEVRPGRREPVNLYCAPVGPPASGKTPAVNLARAPLDEWQAEARSAMAPALAYQRSAIEVAEGQRRAAVSAAAKAQDDAERASAENEAREAAARCALLAPARAPLILGDDLTPEALLQELANQSGRFAVISDEGGFLETVGGRYSRGLANLDGLLKGHSGSDVTVIRKGSGGESSVTLVRRPALTVALCLQPSALRALSRPDFKGRGLLARFVWAVPPPRLGERTGPDEGVDLDAEAVLVYRQRIRGLLGDVPKTLLEAEEGAPLVARIEARGRQILGAWHRELEPRLGPGGDLSDEGIQGWAGKAVGLAARFAGLLHRCSDVPPEGPEIAPETVERAVCLARWALGHAERVFGVALHEEGREADAGRLVAWLRAQRGELSRREIQQRCPASLRRAAVLDAALAAGEADGRIRRGTRTSPAGRPVATFAASVGAATP